MNYRETSVSMYIERLERGVMQEIEVQVEGVVYGDGEVEISAVTDEEGELIELTDTEHIVAVEMLELQAAEDADFIADEDGARFDDAMELRAEMAREMRDAGED